MSGPSDDSPRRIQAVWVVMAVVVLLAGGLLIWAFVRPSADSAGSGTGSSASATVSATGSPADADASNPAGTGAADSPAATESPGSTDVGNADAPAGITPGVTAAATVDGGATYVAGSDSPIPLEFAPVPPSETVRAGDGAGGQVAISLATVEGVEGEANVAGETSGPALRVTLHLQNDSSNGINLDYVVVNAYSGADRAPAPTVMQPGGSPLAGTLAAGQSVDGVYLFTIPEADRTDVLFGVDYVAGQPTVTFRGNFS